MSNNNLLRSDDPEEKKEGTGADKFLLNNYMLNEIKSQEDTARQLIAVSAILIGLYVALITNSQSVEGIRGSFDETYLGFRINYIAWIPVYLWFVNILFNLYALRSRLHDVENLLDIDKSSKYLKDILEFKQNIITFSNVFLIIGVIIVLFITMCAFGYQLNPDVSWYEKGNTLSNQGEYEEAIQAYDRAIELNPNFVEAWNNKGESFRRQGKYNESIQAFDKAIDLNSDYATAWNNKALALYAFGEYNDSIDYFDEAIKLEPDFAEAWCNKGNALYELGKHDKALQAINKSIELNPNFVEAWNSKGEFLRHQGRYNESIDCIDKAIELDPQYAAAWNNKGNILYDVGEYEGAIQAYNRATKLEPDSAVTWRNKGMALNRLGRTTEASTAFAKAKELGYKG